MMMACREGIDFVSCLSTRRFPMSTRLLLRGERQSPALFKAPDVFRSVFRGDLNKFLLLGQNICLDLIDLPRIRHKAIDSCEAPPALVTTETAQASAVNDANATPLGRLLRNVNSKCSARLHVHASGHVSPDVSRGF